MNKAIPLSERFRGLREQYTHYALLLQGGGALGAYQVGAYQALSEAQLFPDWVAGISIGAINGAIIAGNPPELRMERLTRFWDLVTTKFGGRGLFEQFPQMRGDFGREWLSQASSTWSLINGQPNFFKPRFPPPMFWPQGSEEATSFYDTSQLRDTLLSLIDFDRINGGEVRLSVGAVNVRSGNFVYFDNHRRTLTVDHILASCALPPGFPAVMIDGEPYWDGGLVSNTPLQYVIDHEPRVSMLIFQVDLWNARGEAPGTLAEVEERRKHILFSSRTRNATQQLKKSHDMRRAINHVLGGLPAEARQGADYELLRNLSCDSVMNIIHLIYRSKDRNGQAKDYEFSDVARDIHQSAGYFDTRRTLRHDDWLKPPESHIGVVTHDLLADSDD